MEWKVSGPNIGNSYCMYPCDGDECCGAKAKSNTVALHKNIQREPKQQSKSSSKLLSIHGLFMPGPAKIQKLHTFLHRHIFFYQRVPILCCYRCCLFHILPIRTTTTTPPIDRQ